MKQISFIICILYLYLYGQDTLWLRRFDRGKDEYGGDITLDKEGNYLIAGCSENPVPPYQRDILLIKYTPNGDTIWTKYYDDNERELAMAVAIDQDGNIVVAGGSGNDTIERQCLLVKFSEEGNLLWKREYRIRDIDSYTDVAIDSDNNIILTGTSYTYSGGGNHIGFLQKYDRDGNLIWTRFYNWADCFEGIVILPNDNFIVTGADSSWGMLTVCFNLSGDTIWTRRFFWRGQSTFGAKVALDSFGNIIIVGHTTNWSNYDGVIIKYTQNGDTVWTRQFDFTPVDLLGGVATDAFGNIYVSGGVGRLDTFDYLLMKLTPLGEPIWRRFYDNGDDDACWGVVVDVENNPIITGYSSNGVDYDIVTIKYYGAPGIEEKVKKKILFTSENKAKEVYDITGKRIKDLRRMKKGVYFFKDKYFKKVIILN